MNKYEKYMEEQDMLKREELPLKHSCRDCRVHCYSWCEMHDEYTKRIMLGGKS